MTIYGERFSSVVLISHGAKAHLKITTGRNRDKGVFDFTTEVLPVTASHGEISLRIAVDGDGNHRIDWSENDNNWQFVAPDSTASAGKGIGAKAWGLRHLLSGSCTQSRGNLPARFDTTGDGKASDV
ncbi:hypothetical protein [Kosakonia sp. YIM B13611]|uniref:hypothetical protein n=1 Tax=unclassified Kosakonia TaxID=2632876 RepID=UPI0036B5D2A3